MTSLVGRKIRGTYTGRRDIPGKKLADGRNDWEWTQIPLEGEIVAVGHCSESAQTLRFWVLADDARIYYTDGDRVVILPRDFAGPLR